MVEKSKDVLRETDADAIRLAKNLVRLARFGALAALEPGTGAPLASRVGVATDLDCTPLILVSGLSAHTGAIIADPRCSLMLGEPGKGDPLAHARISLACRARRLERGSIEHVRAERRYLNHNPKAKLYVGLGDFSFFRLEVLGASLNGGFGKAYLLGCEDVVSQGPTVESLAEAEQSALDHMNADHGDAVALYARYFGKSALEGWILTGFDADGMDLAAGDETLRILFPKPLASAGDLRMTLVDMAKTARAAAMQQT